MRDLVPSQQSASVRPEMSQDSGMVSLEGKGLESESRATSFER